MVIKITKNKVDLNVIINATKKQLITPILKLRDEIDKIREQGKGYSLHYLRGKLSDLITKIKDIKKIDNFQKKINEFKEYINKFEWM